MTQRSLMEKKKQQRWKKKARRRLFLQTQHARMTLRDWVVMLAVTLVYAVAAFINLGSTDVPNTFYTAQISGDEIVVEFAEPQDIKTIKYYTSFGSGMMSFFYSSDGEGYGQVEIQMQTDQFDEDGQAVYTAEPVSLDHDAIDMYEWTFIKVDFTAKYITLHIDEPGIQMLEMAFCDSEGKPVQIVSVKNLNPDAMRGNSIEYLFDEQHLVPLRTDYMNEMYFDEVYHARTAYGQILHIRPYEITHPPLGKSIIGVGIRIFGMNPFGWRFMGTLFGVLMLPLMYFFAKRLLKKTLYAFIPTFLFAVDFMHFTQTRIATIDSYSIFFILLMYLFMYIYTQKNYNKQSLIKTLIPLGLAGVAFGLGAATKWLCIYAGFGLAVLFFIQMIKRFEEYRYAKSALADTQAYENMDEKKRDYLEGIYRSYVKRAVLTLLWCLLFFIAVPLVIYYLSYIPYMRVIDNPYDFAAILRNQEYMFNYHSKLMTDNPHPFASEWYTWPLNYRPVFFFQGQGYAEGTMSSMSSMGNPAVWWGGLVAITALIVLRIKNGPLGKRTLFISVAALSQFLPWVIIPRETYIYHYFATIPFIILLIGILAKYVIENFKHGKKAIFVYLGICLVLFVMFYPIISGVPFSREYSDTFLRWMPSWPFY